MSSCRDYVHSKSISNFSDFLANFPKSKNSQSFSKEWENESKEHAEMFAAVMDKAAKRFAALAKVEERHATHYRDALAKVSE